MRKTKQTYPKTSEQKLKDTIQKLRAERRTLIKKLKFLEDELINVQKSRLRKEKVILQSDTDWRKEFSKKFKESLGSKDFYDKI